jgi:hypothetical protein
MHSFSLPIEVLGYSGMRFQLFNGVVITSQDLLVWNQVMHRVMAHLAHENGSLHLLLREVPPPPILSMTVPGDQMMFAVNFVNPAKLAPHDH